MGTYPTFHQWQCGAHLINWICGRQKKKKIRKKFKVILTCYTVSKVSLRQRLLVSQFKSRTAEILLFEKVKAATLLHLRKGDRNHKTFNNAPRLVVAQLKCSCRVYARPRVTL